MTRSYKNILNQRFGKLVVVEELCLPNGESKWRCQCDCGGTKIVREEYVTRKTRATRSCGCILKKHGGCVNYVNEPLYRLWIRIKTRCYRESSNNYRNYGARGISLYPEWENNFLLFREYIMTTLGACPKGNTLDRINSDKSYEPGNLRWATRLDQNLNRSKLRTRRTSSQYVGVSWNKLIKKWIAHIGVNYKGIHLGCFNTEIEAALAYNEASKLYFKDKGKLNTV